MRALIFSLLLLSSPALAQPVPMHHPVKETEIKLQTEEEARQSLQKEAKNQEKNIKNLQGNLLDLAGDMTSNEQQLSKLEKRLGELAIEKEEIEQRLGDDQGKLADLILALQRIQRVPPEALIARPGAPLKTAQSAMLLESILPSLYGRADGLKNDLERLADIIQSVEEDKKEFEERQLALKDQQKDMAGLLDERQNFYKKTQGDLEEKEKNIQVISARASNLKDLIARLKADEDARKEKQDSIAARIRSFKKDALPKAGSGQLPVSGIVRVRYGDRDDIGAKSEGIRIEARNGALVVSPMGGIIRYSGDFRNYGQMVIIEHKNGYHSLVAGLAKIDTVVGQSVAAGEPLGMLGDQGSGKPSLYYELRLDGQPINPARKIGDLG